jgi:glutaredoxin 3
MRAELALSTRTEIVRERADRAKLSARMPAPKVTVYTKESCPFCVRAKRLLEKKDVPYEEIDVERDDALRAWLVEKTGQMTVPQIFAGERSLGGFSDVDALDRSGKLDPILRGEG